MMRDKIFNAICLIFPQTRRKEEKAACANKTGQPDLELARPFHPHAVGTMQTNQANFL
jgi:hypothetical protein